MTTEKQQDPGSGTRRRSTSAHDRVRDQLLDEIQSGNFEAGSSLPPERKLAEKFGVSRHSVRQAVSSLVSIGLLEVRWGSGIHVTSAASDEAITRMSDVVFSRSESLADILEVRLAIEPEIAKLAALRRDDKHLARLKRMIRYDHPDEADSQGQAAENNTFHGTIAAATGNEAFTGVLRTLITGPRRALAVIDDHADQRALENHHEQIYAAIEAQDPEAAHHLMQEHMEAVLDIIRRRESRT